jgi:hypothetical protein
LRFSFPARVEAWWNFAASEKLVSCLRARK